MKENAIETICKKSESEIKKELYFETLMKKWQLSDYKINPLYLYCAIEDINTYWNEDVRFREGFTINETKKEIQLPNFFVKINGVYDNKEKNKALLLKLKEDSFYILNEDMVNNNTFIFYKKINVNSCLEEYIEDRLITKKKIKLHKIKSICNKEFPICFLNSKILDYLEKSLNEFIEKSNFDKSLKNQLIIPLIYMNQQLFSLFQNWDFGYKNPKVVIHNTIAKSIDLTSLRICNFLNNMGMDIVFWCEYGERLDLEVKHLSEIRLDKFKEIIDSPIKTKKTKEEKTKSKKIPPYLFGDIIIPLLKIVILLAFVIISVAYMFNFTKVAIFDRTVAIFDRTNAKYETSFSEDEKTEIATFSAIQTNEFAVDENPSFDFYGDKAYRIQEDSITVIKDEENITKECVITVEKNNHVKVDTTTKIEGESKIRITYSFQEDSSSLVKSDNDKFLIFCCLLFMVLMLIWGCSLFFYRFYHRLFW